jgi:hypothetical protein
VPAGAHVAITTGDRDRHIALVGAACAAIGLAALIGSGWPVAAIAIVAAATVPFATAPSIALRLHAAPEEIRATTVAIGRAGVLAASFTGGVLWSFAAGLIGVGAALLLSGALTLLLFGIDRFVVRPQLDTLELTV